MRRVLLLLLLSVRVPCVVAELDTLASEPQWRALLHFPPQGGVSYVDDAGFFLADDGAHSAGSELQATVRLLRDDPQLICRYPARHAWLQDRGYLADVPMPACAEYRQWRQKLDVAEVSLVLASSYLNSPSSMYGHTFLRLDPAGDRGESDFLSFALNFGANIGAEEQDMLYIYRGLFGGYPGLFSLQPYYEKIQEYNRLENRDMWEYHLNLSAAEIDRLLSHAWELRQVNFDYYFFDENCSYRLLELLEVARPGIDLTSPFEYAAMPVDTVRQVVAEGLVADIAYRPSRRLELDTLLDELSSREKKQTKALADGELAIDVFLQQSPTGRQQPVLLAAYRYLRYRYNEAERDADVAQRSLSLLRAARRTGEMAYPDVPRPSRPDRGHETSLLAFTGGVEGENQYLDINWRISYHDALDPISGYPEGATLTMGDTVLRWQDRKGLRLQSFTPISIRSLSTRDRFFAPISWQVGTGVERLSDAPSQPLVAHFTAGGGLGWSLLGGTSFVMANGRLEYNPELPEDWRIAPGIELGQLWQGAQYAAEVNTSLYDFGSQGVRHAVGLSLSRAVDERSAVRLEIDYRDQPWGYSHSGALSWRRYF